METASVCTQKMKWKCRAGVCQPPRRLWSSSDQLLISWHSSQGEVRFQFGGRTKSFFFFTPPVPEMRRLFKCFSLHKLSGSSDGNNRFGLGCRVWIRRPVWVICQLCHLFIDRLGVFHVSVCVCVLMLLLFFPGEAGDKTSCMGTHSLSAEDSTWKVPKAPFKKPESRQILRAVSILVGAASTSDECKAEAACLVVSQSLI